MKYTTIIGMEVHVELKTKSKMFCSCKNDPDLKKPNINICEICLAHPGTLPVPNRLAIEWTVLIGKALNCSIRKLSKFDRKHYFYPDLPKAYQISQYDEPIATGGFLDLDFTTEDNPRAKARIGITRAHLEEDTAKLTHSNDGNTLVDFNRAGTPLVEMVTDPDFQTAQEAKTFCQELRSILRYLDVSDADMEKGHMRCEANVSVQETGKFAIVKGVVKPIGDYKLNNKVEIKNINSFKAVEKAIEYEIKRQTELLSRGTTRDPDFTSGEKGETWPQQTRGWNENKNATVLQRIKENAEDYRYFPEPDIPPFHPMNIAGNISLPELPQAKRDRFHKEYGLSYADAKLLAQSKHWAAFTDEVMSEMVAWLQAMPETTKSSASWQAKNASDKIIEEKRNQLARLAGGWLTSKLMGAMAERAIDIKILKLSAENFAELLALIFTNKVNSLNAQKILIEMLESGVDCDPTHIMEEKGYGKISDESKISAIIDEVIKSYQKQVSEYKSGKEQIMKFLIGMVMKATEGSADPVVAEKLLKEKMK